MSAVQLGAILSRFFSLDELESLSFTLSFEFEELGEGGRTAKSIRMVKYFERTDRLPELAEAILALRPSITWDELTLKGDEVDRAATGMDAAREQSHTSTVVDSYIHSLAFNPDSLLEVQHDSAPESPPVRERQVSGNAVILSAKQERTLHKNLNRVTVLRPASGVIYPGSLVYVDQALKEGQPTPIALNRAPITLTIDLLGLDYEPAEIADPTHSGVKAHLSSILNKWQADHASAYAHAARSSLLLTSAYSPQQIALDLGFNAEWAGPELAAKLRLSNDTGRAVAIALYRQVFYTVTLDTPSSPAAVFADDVSLTQIKRSIHDDAGPAYVRSVEYGRIVLIIMETTAVDTRANLESALGQALSGGFKADAREHSPAARILENATFSAIVVRGGASSTAEFSADVNELDALRHFIRKDATYRPDNPGAPISYTVAFLKDNTLAKMGFATDYIQAEYVRYPNGYVILRHDGAYVARFAVSWQQASDNGDYVDRSWSSGNQSAGYKYQLDLPGDARAVKIHGQAATGLAWDEWGDAINVTEDGPTNKTYRIYGSTLNRKFEIGSASTY